ncbi:hypothetical protein SeLEV6574_g04667 [Synchytrium endobioticum]|uniref:Uncharacterized protein n=1 Tax=Synchytrium endobioticum TaxID=286115 RepID=A0A507CYC1_9FUNG|nr:hypothetical protein SeLEV6574_g04667 [Synchytrium endobioticum]
MDQTPSLTTTYFLVLMSQDKENESVASSLAVSSSPSSSRDLKRGPSTPLTPSTSHKRPRSETTYESPIAKESCTIRTTCLKTPPPTQNESKAQAVLSANPLSTYRWSRLYGGHGRDSRALWALPVREMTSQRVDFSLRKLLGNFISTEHDRYQMVSPHDLVVPPFACSYANVTKGGKILAVADEDGVVTLIDTLVDTRAPLEESIKMEWTAHENAIFDIVWSADDIRVMTASGDQTVRVWDVATQSSIGTLGVHLFGASDPLNGHQGSVKTVANHPHEPSMYVTCSRDGRMLLWDLRIPGKGLPDGSMAHKPVYMINGAHVPESKTKSRRRTPARAQSFSSAHSVTAALFLPGSTMRIASAGAADGLVKIWDMRMGEVFTDISQNSVARSRLPEGLKRPHGLTSLTMNSNGSLLFASCSDNSVHVYNSSSLSQPICQLRADTFKVTSFYVKTAVSPDDRFLASGSSDGGLYVWDVESYLKRDHMSKYGPIILKGHTSEVTSVSWSGGGDISQQHIANASDDMTVRVWKWDAKVVSDLQNGKVSNRPTHLWGTAVDAEGYTGNHAVLPSLPRHRSPLNIRNM